MLDDDDEPLMSVSKATPATQPSSAPQVPPPSQPVIETAQSQVDVPDFLKDAFE
jgi:hypothetical protein